MKTNVLLSALLIINFISPFYSFANGISTPDADKNRPLIKTIDSISVISKELTLIVVGYEGCAPCKTLKNSDYYKNLTIGKTYLDILNSSDEKLFSQLFFITGFPTSIVMDSDWNLKSIVLGYRNYEARMDSVLNLGAKLYDIRLNSIESDKAVDMFAYSLKALRCYWSGDYVQTQRLALKSRENGEYFFNNYLLYVAATKRGDSGDAALYKNEIATKFSDKMHRSIYAEMFTEMQL